MLIDAMSAMMEQVGPLSVHYLSTKPPADKRALTDQVLKQMRRDFFVASPFSLHASVPELMAGAWSLVRETLMCGEAPRGRKEIIASGVSNANRCPFCVDAHTAAVIASRTSDASLARWAEATGQSDHPALRQLPFDGQYGEYLGTTVAFHYLNRMVSVFLAEKMMPVPNFLDRTASFMARIMMGGMLRRGSRNRPGDSLALLPEVRRAGAWEPAWAKDTSHVAGAIAGWSAINETLVEAHLDPEVVSGVRTAIEGWSGGEIYEEVDWLARRRPLVAEEHRPAVDLGLMTAMAPYRVTDEAVRATLKAGLSKEQLLVLVAWSAHLAARQTVQWVTKAAGI